MSGTMKKWFVGLACALLWTGCIVTPGAVKAAEGQTIQAVGDPADELAEREVVKDAVGSAIASRDVVALSQMADRFRRERERTGSGV